MAKQKGIDLKYKIPLVGKFNTGIYICPNCDCDLLANPKHGIVHQHIIGFSHHFSIGDVAIVICPECFKKWYFHSRSYGNNVYEYFLRLVKNGEQKYFTK